MGGEHCRDESTPESLTLPGAACPFAQVGDVGTHIMFYICLPDFKMDFREDDRGSGLELRTGNHSSRMVSVCVCVWHSGPQTAGVFRH